LETSENYLQDPLARLKTHAGKNPTLTTIQYERLFPILETKRLPVYFADVHLVEDKAADVENLLVAGEATLSAYLLAKTAQETKHAPISRRDFLKLGGKAALATWLSIPFMSDLGISASLEMREGRSASAEFKKASHRLHPEARLLIDTVRNIVIAHKEQRLMEYMKSHPHLVTILGAAHVGIENDIQSSAEKRLAFLQTLKPILHKVYTPGTFYRAVRMDFDGKNWQVGDTFEFPELKALIT